MKNEGKTKQTSHSHHMPYSATMYSVAVKLLPSQCIFEEGEYQKLMPTSGPFEYMLCLK